MFAYQGLAEVGFCVVTVDSDTGDVATVVGSSFALQLHEAGGVLSGENVDS